MTARQLLQRLAAFNPTAVPGGGIEHDDAPELDPVIRVLATGAEALLTGREWLGCDGSTGHCFALSADALIPDGVTLLSVMGSATWDRVPANARAQLPGLFADPPKRRTPARKLAHAAPDDAGVFAT